VDRNAIIERTSGDIPQGADQAWLQNNYYRDAFLGIMRIANIQAVLILALTLSISVYIHTDKRRDRFFAEAQENRRMQMTGLDFPNMGKVALANWVVQAATQIMTFGFNDINQRLALSQTNFTPNGWESFYKAMVQSELVKNVIAAQQLVTAIPMSPPVLIQQGIIKGKYSWVYEMQMMVTFRSGGVQRAGARTVRMVIEAVSTRDNPTGVGISEWYIY